jgi:hypothetical protein
VAHVWHGCRQQALKSDGAPVFTVPDQVVGTVVPSGQSGGTLLLSTIMEFKQKNHKDMQAVYELLSADYKPGPELAAALPEAALEVVRELLSVDPDASAWEYRLLGLAPQREISTPGRSASQMLNKVRSRVSLRLIDSHRVDAVVASD